MSPLRPLLCLVAACLCSAEEPATAAAASPWPMDIPISGGVITLYQPQPETLDGNQLKGRSAVSFLPAGKGEDERVFGAMWMTATLDIDREHDVARARALAITRVVTPKGEKSPDEGQAARKAIQDAVLAKGIEIDLDRLVATLEEPADDATAAVAVKPPRILVRTAPALLVVCDGEPKVQELGGVRRVVNTPAFVAADAAGTWWLRSEQDWLTAPAMTGPWSIPTGWPPKAVSDAAKEAGFPTSVLRGGDDKAPEVIQVQEPAELVLFDGKPSFEPIGDGALLGASNSDDDVLIEVATGRHFLLLAGRWFSAARIDEGVVWTSVAPDQLPTAFDDLPRTGPWARLRTHVPGTREAAEAVAQQQVPQTARIPRSAIITVTYDGEPQWAQVEGHLVEYALNSGDAVFRLLGPQYFACRDGVWYQGVDPRGPLAVATSVPEALRRLPPECPWSNCSAVEVYQSDTQYVWCGYTPAYLGWYSYHGCPVYGTGIWYHGWYGHHVYPQPLTWGAAVRYNPVTGWGVAAVGVRGPYGGVAVAVGGFHVNRWYGSGGAHPLPAAGTVRVASGAAQAAALATANRPALYERVQGAERPRLEDSAQRLRAAARPAGAPARENLAVDRDGNIGRPTADGGWQMRQDGNWKDLPRPERAAPATRQQAVREPVQTQPAPRPAQRPAPTPLQRPAQPPATSFQRTQELRQRGEQRVQQRSAPPPPPRAAGGGGGRRR